ncbi:MAG: tetratricopeptide repeat protein [Acidimicrobiaceae bacterium]|nr:tetratricopeptide repeat protein [Acidimicrobiaceae bacterium]
MSAASSESSGGLQQANILVELGRYREAEQLLAPYLASNPADARGLCLMAQCQLEQQRPEAAAATAASASVADPSSVWAHRLRAIALSRAGHHGEACAEGQEAVRLAPASDLAHSALAVCLLHGRFLAQARDAATRATELNPARADHWVTLSAVHLAARANAEATSCANRALELDPHSVQAVNNLGVVQLRRRRFLSALQLFVTAVRLDPQFEPSLRNIGTALWTAFFMVLLAVVVAIRISPIAAAVVGVLGAAGLALLVVRLPHGAARAGLRALRRHRSGLRRRQRSGPR